MPSKGRFPFPFTDSHETKEGESTLTGMLLSLMPFQVSEFTGNGLKINKIKLTQSFYNLNIDTYKKHERIQSFTDCKYVLHMRNILKGIHALKEQLSKGSLII